MTTKKNGEGVKRGDGLRGLRRDCGRLRASAGHVGGRCPTVHPENMLLKHDEGPELHEVFELSRAKEESVHRV